MAHARKRFGVKGLRPRTSVLEKLAALEPGRSTLVTCSSHTVADNARKLAGTF